MILSSAGSALVSENAGCHVPDRIERFPGFTAVAGLLAFDAFDAEKQSEALTLLSHGVKT